MAGIQSPSAVCLGRSRVLAATLAIVAPVAALAIASPDPAPAGAPSAQLRPDLFTRAAHELYIDREAPELRFSNEIGNRGPGPLEIRPEGPTTDDCNHDGVLTNDAWVDQRIYGDDDGNGHFARRLDTSYDAVRAGCMFFHIAHNHWHFDDVARYELFRESDGRRVAAANKVSFCLIDTELLQPDTPGSPASPWYGVRTGSCASQTATEGISVGWADDYERRPRRPVDVAQGDPHRPLLPDLDRRPRQPARRAPRAQQHSSEPDRDPPRVTPGQPPAGAL